MTTELGGDPNGSVGALVRVGAAEETQIAILSAGLAPERVSLDCDPVVNHPGVVDALGRAGGLVVADIDQMQLWRQGRIARASHRPPGPVLSLYDGGAVQHRCEGRAQESGMVVDEVEIVSTLVGR